MPGPGDEAWTELDRVKALAWQAEQNARCGGCGHPLDESMDPDNEEGVYEVRHSVCHACAARERAIEKHEGSKTGRFFIVERGAHG